MTEQEKQMIAGLADLYRMLTVHGGEALILLEQERRLVEAYLAMEQMRLGERLRVAWRWPDWADGLRLPPFCLLPMVENAAWSRVTLSGTRATKLRPVMMVSACPVPSPP